MGSGRFKLIGNDMEQKARIKNVRIGGGNISAAVVMGAAEKVCMFYWWLLEFTALVGDMGAGICFTGGCYGCWSLSDIKPPQQ